MIRLAALLALALSACAMDPVPPPCWPDGTAFQACAVALDANHYAGRRWEELQCEGVIPELYPGAPYLVDTHWDPERSYAEWIRLLTAETCAELILEPCLASENPPSPGE